MKTLKELLDESLVNEFRNWVSPESSEEARRKEQQLESDRKKELKDFLLNLANKNKLDVDILRGVDTFGKVWEQGETPIVIIGDKDNENEICVSIYITATGIVSRYYYKGLSFINARDIWEYFSDLSVDYNKTNIPDIPKTWWKRSTNLQTKTGSLQPMKDEFINIVEKATKLQRKMKF